ncbi:MAG: hypothetical protein ACM3ZU_07320 [Bacteroidota bacterium]
MIRNSRRIRVRSVVALFLMLSLLAVTAPSACLAASGEEAGTGRGAQAQDPGSVQAAQDMLAPVIEIVSPPHGGVTSDRSPEIVVRYVDPDSGVDPDTVVLILDKADVTRWADIGAEEARYTPRPPLKDGGHTVELAVADRAGNVARATWEFTVAGAPPLGERTEIMLDDSLKVEVLPVASVANAADVAARIRLPVGTLAARLTLRSQTFGLLGYDFRMGDLKTAVERCSVEFAGNGLSLVAGDTAVPVPAALILPERQLAGFAASGVHRTEAGSYELSAFTGKLLVSKGLAFSVFDAWGVHGGFSLADGGFGGDAAYVLARKGARDEDVYWARVELPLGARGALSCEVARTIESALEPGSSAGAGAGARSGSGSEPGRGSGQGSADIDSNALLLAAHARLGPVVAYTEYRLQGAGFAPSPMSPTGRGGVRSLRARLGAQIAEGLAATVDVARAADNVDGSQGYSTTDTNLAGSLVFVPQAGRVSYSLDVLSAARLSDDGDGARRSIDSSKRGVAVGAEIGIATGLAGPPQASDSPDINRYLSGRIRYSNTETVDRAHGALTTEEGLDGKASIALGTCEIQAEGKIAESRRLHEDVRASERELAVSMARPVEIGYRYLARLNVAGEAAFKDVTTSRLSTGALKDSRGQISLGLELTLNLTDSTQFKAAYRRTRNNGGFAGVTWDEDMLQFELRLRYGDRS